MGEAPLPPRPVQPRPRQPRPAAPGAPDPAVAAGKGRGFGAWPGGDGGVVGKAQERRSGECEIIFRSGKEKFEERLGAQLRV